jgi:hypothetical protein
MFIRHESVRYRFAPGAFTGLLNRYELVNVRVNGLKIAQGRLQDTSRGV